MTARTVIAGVIRRRPSGRASTDPACPLEERLGGPARGLLEPGLSPPGGLDAVARAPLTPLAVRPVGVSRRAALEMLMDSVEGLALDRADRSLLVRAEVVWDTADVVILASLLARSRALPAVSQLPVGQDARWVTWCPDCRLPAITGPVTLDEAETLGRAHDRVHHGGVWMAGAVPLPPGPEQASTAAASGRRRVGAR